MCQAPIRSIIVVLKRVARRGESSSRDVRDDDGVRFRAAIVGVAPAVLLAAFVYHPYITPPTDPEAIASAAADTTRWGLAHLAIGVGYGLAVLAFLAIGSYLRQAGEERWSSLGL